MSDIASELSRLAAKLEYDCDLPLYRLCFLVTKDERKELVEWFKTTQRFVNEDAPAIDTESPFFIRRIEVRTK